MTARELLFFSTAAISQKMTPQKAESKLRTIYF
jgi:hypothetical protein